MQITTANDSLAGRAHNMGHVSVFEKMPLGDASYKAQGLLGLTHLRLLSCSPLFKMLLDSGWLRSFTAHTRDNRHPGLAAKLVEAARLLS